MATAAAPLVNGFASPALDGAGHVAEYEKILKLHDEVFSGTHPRLTVPTHLLRKVSPSSSQLSAQSSLVPLPLPVPSQQPQPQLPGLYITQEQEKDERRQQALATTDAQPQQAITPSGINPVLLTKSDDLIKAELQLQRNRLEKQLRDQFEQKRLDFRKKPSPAEAKPDFDVSALLKYALEVAKPESLSKEPDDKGEPSDSFDENSFYSSKAPDSTPEAGERSQSPAEQQAQAMPGVSVVPASTVAHDRSYAPQFAATRSAQNGNPIDLDDDDDEEGEYSPPEAMDQYPSRNELGPNTVPDVRSRHMRRYSDLEDVNKQPTSPTDGNLRIVRNHITSPLAPRPSRVSPLTLAKDSLGSQDRRMRNGRDRVRAKSPSESPEPTGSRSKKRKLDRKVDKRGKRIKQEPISPPPFHDIQPLGSGNARIVDSQPIIIDDQPLPEMRYARPPPERYIEVPSRPSSRQLEPLPPMSEPRPLSRATMRPRDDQDLRRVASLHNMRAEQSREYPDYATPTKVRAASYMRVESPMREVAPQYQPDLEAVPREVRVVRTPGPEYRDMYQQPPQHVRYEPMPPPTTRVRIVEDGFGRRYREIIEESSPMAAGSPYARQSIPSQYYDPQRATSVMVDERTQPRYEPEMPPPRMVRPLPEQSEPSTPMVYSRREVYSQPRLSQVPIERPTRQPVYADEAQDFRPPPRLGSARPQPPQYDDRPIQVLQRPPSVRALRERSVFVDDRAPVRGEYVPEPQYRVIEPEPQIRYVDTQGREVLPPPQEMGRIQHVQRY